MSQEKMQPEPIKEYYIPAFAEEIDDTNTL